jgi:hypothetical protein
LPADFGLGSSVIMISYSFLLRMLLLTLVVLSSALFGVDKERDGLKQVYTQALKERDLWTCLQIEAWQTEVFKEKVSVPVLGRSRIIGSPRLAFPDRIR